ncbi:hypothetical protein PFISCL1PPCAC_5317, partial [Pristionchus fissidentatus]
FLYRLFAVRGSRFLRLFENPFFYLLQFAFHINKSSRRFSVAFYVFVPDEYGVEYMQHVLATRTGSSALPLEDYTVAFY